MKVAAAPALCVTRRLPARGTQAQEKTDKNENQSRVIKAKPALIRNKKSRPSTNTDLLGDDGNEGDRGRGCWVIAAHVTDSCL